MQYGPTRFNALALSLASALSALVAPSNAMAQRSDAKDLDNVVVTATRTTTTADAMLDGSGIFDLDHDLGP